MGTVRFGFGLFTFGLIRVGSKWIRFETDWVISGVSHFGSYQILVSVRLWVGLLQMFGSKSVVFISDVGSGMDSGCSVRVSALFCQVYMYAYIIAFVCCLWYYV